MKTVCSICGAHNHIVNQCRCDPDNLPTRVECLFQEDNDGRGAEICEIWRENNTGHRRVRLHLNHPVLDYLIRQGYSGLFLTYRGVWYELHKLYR